MAVTRAIAAAYFTMANDHNMLGAAALRAPYSIASGDKRMPEENSPSNMRPAHDEQEERMMLSDAYRQLYETNPSDESEESQDASAAANEALADLDAQVGDEGSRAFDSANVGLGVDIVEIARMKALLKRSPHFKEYVYSPDERAYCDRCGSPETHYALRFAAKEAVLKAIGTGFSEGIGARDIEVRRNAKGKPVVVLHAAALEAARKRGVKEIPLSLSYTHTQAVACAMAITEASRKAQEERKDPREELARKFKETRSILDEL